LIKRRLRRSKGFTLGRRGAKYSHQLCRAPGSRSTIQQDPLLENKLKKLKF